ncbi:MAG TPA: PAS-domain containing protein [Rhodopila sp.]
MSDKFKRRRSRTGTRSTRFGPRQLVPVESVRPARMGKVELAACAAVIIVATALIVLVWIVTTRAMQEQRTEIRDRTEAVLAGQAAVMAETISHELLLIDQSLIILQDAWRTDSDSVDLNKWQQKMPALTAVTDDLFICDEQHIIRQDILPQAVGQGVGAAYVTFPHGSLEHLESNGTTDKETLLLQGELGAPIDARQFLMYIVRPLDHPAGWLLGASYRSAELTKLFAQAALGNNAVVALTDTRRGVVQAVVGPAARRPVTDISKMPLFDLMSRAPAGTWAGQTGIDGIERLHAFHRIGDRDMAVLVGTTMAEVMAPAKDLVGGMRALAFVATALVVAIGALVLWGLSNIRADRRQKRVFDRYKNELDRLRSGETVITARADLNAARLQIVLDNTTDGVALFDSGLRLVQWNHPFQRGIGIDPRQGMSLDTMLREQAARGLLGSIADIEREVIRRVAVLRAGDAAGLKQLGPNHETLVLRGLPIAEGGFMLLLNGLTTWEPAPPPPPSTEMDRSVAAEPAARAPAPIEW